MKRLLHRRVTSRPLIKAAAAASIIALTLAACGSDDDNGSTAAPGDEDGDPAEEEWNPDPNAEVTISYSNFPTSDKPETVERAGEIEEEFNALYPNVTLEGNELIFDAQSFNAMLAGGTLPTVMRVPFTEINRLMVNRQAADLTDGLAEQQVLSSINPTLVGLATNEDGRVFGVPTGSYALGILYNRAVFEEAGLDPEDPPQTWDDVRAAAKAISDTGTPGFILPTTEAFGGWMLNGMANAFGGELEHEDGDSYVVNLASNEAAMQAIEWLKALRWEDDSMGANYLMNQDDVMTEIAAARAGMTIGASGAYLNMTGPREMPEEDFGIGPMPQDDDGLGAQAGGTFDIISPHATQDEIAAALTWIEFRDYRVYTDEETAVAEAEAAVADERNVGIPRLSIFGQEVEETYLGWVEEYVNVPRENYAAYFDSVYEMELLGEPPAKAQELYAALSPVVQAVLTDEGADLEGMLAQVESDVTNLIAQG